MSEHITDLRGLRNAWAQAILEVIAGLANAGRVEAGPGELRELLIPEKPPNPELGDLAFPMFPFSRILRRAPQQIASQVAETLAEGAAEAAAGTSTPRPPGTASAAGPYVNIRYDRPWLCGTLLEDVTRRGEAYGRGQAVPDVTGKRIMCEFSAPNTNKPLHLGHLRNDCLGESVSRILAAAGAEMRKVNLVNDRGVHICKSMLAYRKFGEGRTPEDEGLKPDHFVGKYYVLYDRWAKEDPSAEEQARDMLRAWERGDPEVTALWKTMNGWAVAGLEQTYRRTGISFDAIYFESRTYRLGRGEVMKGLERGLFYKKEDGSVWVDLSEHNLDQKVLLRGDGTSVYATQDLGTAIMRYEDWPFDRQIYVVASEQTYHFKVLFKVLELLGYEWADSLYHLAYGMVHLPEGKMKSREGTVVDADDLIDTLRELAKQEIRDKGREEELDDVDDTAEKVALGALSYYLLQPGPLKDITFNPAESISFTGRTGPYLQYTGARLSSILRKYEERRSSKGGGAFRPDYLTVGEEWEIVKLLASYPDRLALAAQELNPAHIAGHLYELARTCNKYYHDNPVLHNEDLDLVRTRIALIAAVRTVLHSGMHLLGIPFLERM